jgi:hypothetical protein
MREEVRGNQSPTASDGAVVEGRLKVQNSNIDILGTLDTPQDS